MEQKHVLSVLVENSSGVLSRVAGLFSRRGYNIDSLTVGKTDNEEVSRMTITITGDNDVLEQVTKQLEKLEEVIKVINLKPDSSVYRELVLIKVKATAEKRADINEIVKYDSNHPLYLIVNARGKDNRVLGILKEIKTVEEYDKGVTAQVVGVVNMNAYNARIDEENRQKEIAKQKASIEKELKSEIEKMNNIALYEKMAKEHPENPRLAELVNALKELGE